MVAVRYVPLGYQQLTNLATVQTLTVPQGADFAIIHCETQGVRWRDDGADPTPSSGMLLNINDPPMQYSGNLKAIRLIAATGSPSVSVSFYKLVG